MDYIKEYKNFVNSHYLSEGVRMTAGIVLPAIVLSHFNFLAAGIVVSLGAMCVSLTDTLGPIHHRINGMTACFISTFVVSLLTGLAAPYPVIMGILLVCVCFIFSMINVYGSRANSIGVAVLYVMVLNIDSHHSADRYHAGVAVIYNALYILTGGVWYMLMSLLLYRVRPYKLAKQALGDCIVATSEYLRARASFYGKDINYEATYQQVMQQQIVAQEKQNLVRELLFKTRSIVKESTDTGRTLVMIFRDTVDLFERTMTSYQDYEALHNYFKNSDILYRYQLIILEISKELDNIGLAIKVGYASEDNGELQKHFHKLQEYFEKYRDIKRTPENLEGFISLRHILNGLEDIISRVHTLHLYTTYSVKHSKNNPSEVEYEKFITHTVIDSKLIRDNLSLKSNTFRHAIRVSVATLFGYIISKFLPIGHSYWILLTIIVILKPAYSLTKKRNYDRLLGTIAGALFGLIILFFIQDKNTLFALMLLLMIITYSLFRTNYLVSVFFMTPYIMLLFHLLFGINTKNILIDRVTDTAIGSAIAFLANFFLIPAWEKDQIKNYMTQALEANINYFKNISGAFTGMVSAATEYKVRRKNAFVSLANLSDAFSRMLQEPKNKQTNAKSIYQFVTLNHMLTSHIATLSYYIEPLALKYNSPDFVPIVNNSLQELEQAKSILINDTVKNVSSNEERNNNLDKRVNELMEKRKTELQQGLTETETKKTLSEFKSIADQFNFISKISFDIKKVSEQLATKLNKF
jgi:uncharacterized membrane protein (TIGR01666 family)